MEAQKVDIFIMTNAKFFESHQILLLQERLLGLEDDKWSCIQTLQFKDPTISLVVSLLGGHLGIDRFIIGDTGLGIVKLLTCGGFGIWTIVDFFLIMGATRRNNLEKINALI